MEYTYEEFIKEFVSLMKANLSQYGMEVSIVNKMRNNGILEKCIKVYICRAITKKKYIDIDYYVN